MRKADDCEEKTHSGLNMEHSIFEKSKAIINEKSSVVSRFHLRFSNECLQGETRLDLRVDLVHDDNIVGSRILAEAIGVLNVVVENFDDVDVVFVPAKWIGGDAQKTKPNSIQEERNDVDGRVEECTNNGISRGAADGILLKLDYVVAQDGGDAKDVEDQSGCENQQFRDTLT